MRVAVCDDNELEREMVCSLLDTVFAENKVRPDLTGYESGIELLGDIRNGAWFDVIFLDIYMVDHLGIDVARRLRESGYRGEIVFLTAAPEFALESYYVFAAGYILKPVSGEKLARVVERLTRSLEEKAYAIRQRSAVLRIPYTEILYVESSNSKCILYRSDGSDYTIYKRLDEIETELADPRFLRCHQSYLVNMDHIQSAGRQFRLTTGQEVMIRQRNLKAIRETYLRYSGAKKPDA